MATISSYLRPATLMRGFALVAAISTTQATATTQELPPVKVHVFGAESIAAGGVPRDIAESVADFKKAVNEKLPKTMRLVETRAEADIAVEVLGRDKRTNSDVRLQIHHRGGQTTLTQDYQLLAGIGGGPMNMLNLWSQQYYKAVVGLEPPDAIRQVPPNIFLELGILIHPRRGLDASIQANAAARIGSWRQRPREITAALVAHLGNTSVVRVVTEIGFFGSLPRTSVGVVAGRALVSIGAIDEIYSALASDMRESARVNAALTLSAVPGAKTTAALQAASGNDNSKRVREAAQQALDALEQLGSKP